MQLHLKIPITALSVDGIPILAQERAGQELWQADSGARTWAEFGEAVELAREQCTHAGIRPGEILVIPGEAAFDTMVWLFAAAATGAIVAPLRRERIDELDAWRNTIHVGWLAREGQIVRLAQGKHSPAAAQLIAELQQRHHPGLILATGGTTGAPKLVLHDLSALLATVPVKNAPAKRMLPLMRFDHIGGLDMAWRALAGQQVLVEPPAEFTPSAVAATIERHRVEVLPASPSFLNLLLLARVHQAHDLSSLRTIPFGAEAMPTGLLTRLRTAFRGVEFVQRFGTSETGALPVQDQNGGLALRKDQSGFTWKIVEDELWVKSPARALGYLSGEVGGFDSSGWFRTGDLAEHLPDGTIRILGRREQLINVGGEKVLPGEVESVLLTHPQVADCRVESAASAVLGQIVAAEIVWTGPETDPLVVKWTLYAFAKGLLARHKLPAVVKLVPEIGTTRNLKKSRISQS